MLAVEEQFVCERCLSVSDTVVLFGCNYLFNLRLDYIFISIKSVFISIKCFRLVKTINESAELVIVY